MNNYPEDRIGYPAALRYAKKAIGTDERFFPNRRTMVTTWHIVAEVIELAMALAWRIGYWQGRNLTQRAADICPNSRNGQHKLEKALQSYEKCSLCGKRR